MCGRQSGRQGPLPSGGKTSQPLPVLASPKANFSFASLVLDLLNFLMEAIQINFQQASAMGSSSRAQQALNQLHTLDKTVEMTDQLMVRWAEAPQHRLGEGGSGSRGQPAEKPPSFHPSEPGLSSGLRSRQWHLSEVNIPG